MEHIKDNNNIVMDEDDLLCQLHGDKARVVVLNSLQPRILK